MGVVRSGRHPYPRPPAPETIRGTLEHLDRKCGGVKTYITKNGLEPNAVERLREDLAA